MPSAILQQLETYGPRNCEKLTYEQAAAYTRRLARSHYENFSVVTWFVPARLREDFANVYAFCRWADDLGDEVGDTEESLKLLHWWKRELIACYDNKPRHPVFVALHRTVRKHDIPIRPFADLIDAFEQDQRIHRYQNWKQVLDYCTRSADPVGRLVLYLSGYHDPIRQQLSDKTCTALQLVNFWQDVRRDIEERDRIYVPADVLARHGLSHDDLTNHVEGERSLLSQRREDFCKVIRDLCERTAPLFAEGRNLWPLVDKDVRLPIKLFTLGGETVLNRIAQQGYDTLDRRPRVGKVTKLWLMARAALGKLTGVGV